MANLNNCVKSQSMKMLINYSIWGVWLPPNMAFLDIFFFKLVCSFLNQQKAAYKTGFLACFRVMLYHSKLCCFRHLSWMVFGVPHHLTYWSMFPCSQISSWLLLKENIYIYILVLPIRQLNLKLVVLSIFLKMLYWCTSVVDMKERTQAIWQLK